MRHLQASVMHACCTEIYRVSAHYLQPHGPCRLDDALKFHSGSVAQHCRESIHRSMDAALGHRCSYLTNTTEVQNAVAMVLGLFLQIVPGRIQLDQLAKVSYDLCSCSCPVDKHLNGSSEALHIERGV